MEQATVDIELGDRTVTLAVRLDQLTHRQQGDLITAEIVAVYPCGSHGP